MVGFFFRVNGDGGCCETGCSVAVKVDISKLGHEESAYFCGRNNKSVQNYAWCSLIVNGIHVCCEVK